MQRLTMAAGLIVASFAFGAAAQEPEVTLKVAPFPRADRAGPRSLRRALGPAGRGTVGRPHQGRDLSLDVARRQPAAAVRQLRDGVADIVWTVTSYTPGHVPAHRGVRAAVRAYQHAVATNLAIQDLYDDGSRRSIRTCTRS